MEMEKRLVEIIKEKASAENSDKEIGYDEDITVLGISSRSYVMLLVALEDEFGIEIDDEDMSFENFKTINKIAAYIKSKT